MAFLFDLQIDTSDLSLLRVDIYFVSKFFGSKPMLSEV